jgi:DNA-binding NtrC family response regulator
MVRQRILIVDDEANVTDYLRYELEDYNPNWEIISINSGLKALQLIMEDNVDLLLTDIAMPDMDGYELFSRTKEIRPNLPIIMMTGFGYDPNHAVVKSRKKGLRDIVFKPFNMVELFTLINSKLSDKK